MKKIILFLSILCFQCETYYKKNIESDCDFVLPNGYTLKSNNYNEWVLQENNLNFYFGFMTSDSEKPSFNGFFAGTEYRRTIMFNDSCQAKGALKSYLLERSKVMAK